VKYKVSDLLTCVPTNSLTWNELSYDEESSLKNIHYGLIHNGFTTTCILCDNKLIPYVNTDSFPKQYRCVEKGDLILADASEDRKDVGRTVEIIDTNNEITISGLHTIHAKNVSSLFKVGYKGYYFNSIAMKKQMVLYRFATRL
jgi:type I restriction enzyme S subunit